MAKKTGKLNITKVLTTSKPVKKGGQPARRTDRRISTGEGGRAGAQTPTIDSFVDALPKLPATGDDSGSSPNTEGTGSDLDSPAKD